MAAMSVSERINLAKQDDNIGPWRRPEHEEPLDGLADFKTKLHDSLFSRLGTRLFETQDEGQLHSMVVSEIGALLTENDRALSHTEKQNLVRDIARDVMGLGPIEQFLA